MVYAADWIAFNASIRRPNLNKHEKSYANISIYYLSFLFIINIGPIQLQVTLT